MRWVRGRELPAGLRLHLPAGPRLPLPRAGWALPSLPASFTTRCAQVIWEARVPRGTAQQLFAALLCRLLFRELRQEGGLSYQVEADYCRLDPEFAIVSACADAVDDGHAAVVGGLVEVLTRIRLGVFPVADLEAVRDQRIDTVLRAPSTEPWVMSQALQHLVEQTVTDPDQLVAELRRVTPEQVTAVAAAAWQDSLLMTPHEVNTLWTGLRQLPEPEQITVSGRSYPHRSDSNRRLIVGEQGAGLQWGRTATSVRPSDCAAVLRYPDGDVELVAINGDRVPLFPSRFAIEPGVVEDFVHRLDPELVIPMPPKPTEQPDPTAQPVAGTQRAGRVRARVVRGAVALVYVLWLISLSALPVDKESGHDHSAATNFIGGFSVAVLLMTLFLLGRLAWHGVRSMTALLRR